MQDTQSTIRELDVHIITDAVRQMCIDANHTLSADMRDSLQKALETEKSKLGRKVLEQLELNLKIAGQDRIPICQDTGMAVVFMEVGQDVHLCGGDLTEAVNEGVRQGYVNGYLRKSVVSDPLLRKNTGDNTPAVLHVSIVPGTKVRITVAPKGFGSENADACGWRSRRDCRCGSGGEGRRAERVPADGHWCWYWRNI